MSVHETARYLNADEFVSWLIGRYGEQYIAETVTAKDNSKSGKYARRWYAWREEQDLICVYTADSWLVNVFHLNIQDVPECCFTERPRTYRKATPEDKAEAIRRVEAGESQRSVARDIGVSYAALTKWVLKASRGETFAAKDQVAA